MKKLCGKSIASSPSAMRCLFTKIHVKGKYYELTFYFDSFTKEILSYALATRKGDSKQYYDGLKDVLELIKNEECTEPVILHTDQGSVYSSLSYNELISNYNIKRSMSRAGTPTDNPVNESLNGWIKEELILDFKLKESNDVEKTIKDYVHYYNNERPKSELGGLPPVQFRLQNNSVVTAAKHNKKLITAAVF